MSFVHHETVRFRDLDSLAHMNNAVYATFLEQEGPSHLTFRGQGGEEIVLAAAPKDGATLVTGSTYLFDMQVARFFATLPPAAGQ